ncbi:GNAT family N-acetyltransferase [Planococcus sp. CP5-4]|uniref:GNAT family N-acetyltransferase n=1 Tax=unclassified Planococcus (in: firmicutes) TaxID=2662419 RepID=UPI001C24F990|nr:MULTISPECIES: GNAT family protein [unclassified Planococcus (in: firmicutes)]MBU9675034.1 GNAT family N-acetyltransferase [Planococcus sp. CP5-4_YE]MBV0910384.1 GNAT family N-acetyltransferase [Planococcus sp. CP5-4_UN]MBW6063840.1 GNAT family N-acetyltransferase [Planococcus sp. CP5-4]
MLVNTERLVIRPFQAEDIQDVFAIYSDKEVCQYLLHEEWHVGNMEGKFNKKLVNRSLTPNTMISLAVVLDEQVIGDLSAWYTDMKDTVEIGYSFSSASGGKGYATEAVESLMAHLFNDYHVHRIQATLDARNTASQKLCERIGMRKEAYFIQDYWNKNEWTDSVVYGMLDHELNKI